ncbi:MBL fold metallo-hydrolase [Enemella sp. A6]|uniref:MBL fold metallo-hydrolase n=1 Tax=Enemella sp. A6 TaxID=3440152 RepID=UPI003EBCB689
MSSFAWPDTQPPGELGPKHILAPNPGPMSLDGTNTWLLPTDGGMIVVDPGPDDPDHLTAIVELAGTVEEIWVTHRHIDHIEATGPLANRTGNPPIRAFDPELCVGEPLGADDEINLGNGAALRVLHIPGHTDDSIGFLHTAPGEPARLMTGDMVLGRGTTVIVPPDGNLTSYFASLDLMEQVCLDHEVTELLPGHAPVLTDPVGVLRYYRNHRTERLAQIREAVQAGHRTPDAVVEHVYDDAPANVKFAARLSSIAQLYHLRETEGMEVELTAAELAHPYPDW